MAKHLKARIISNQRVVSDYYKISLGIDYPVKDIAPGQFFNVKCGDGLTPLLRRPFSVHRASGRGTVEVLYEVVGEATRALSRKKRGMLLDAIGPLGSGFDVSTKRHVIMVAGGMGVAPLVFLAQRISKARHAALIGAKTAKGILCEKDFKNMGLEVLCATEDGSKGEKGLATDLLKSFLRTTRDSRLSAEANLPSTHATAKAKRTAIYACGPAPMLKEVAKIAASRNIDAYGSFEEHMACGVGSCYGCVIRTKQDYKRVCKEGPVFSLEEIVWE